MKAELEAQISNCLINQNGRYCDLSVFYKEDGEYKQGVEITLVADDKSVFVGNGKRYEKKITIATSSRTGVQNFGVLIQYEPKTKGERTLSISVGETKLELKTIGKIE